MKIDEQEFKRSYCTEDRDIRVRIEDVRIEEGVSVYVDVWLAKSVTDDEPVTFNIRWGDVDRLIDLIDDAMRDFSKLEMPQIGPSPEEGKPS